MSARVCTSTRPRSRPNGRAAARKALRPLSYPVARGAFAARGRGVPRSVRVLAALIETLPPPLDSAAPCSHRRTRQPLDHAGRGRPALGRPCDRDAAPHLPLARIFRILASGERGTSRRACSVRRASRPARSSGACSTMCVPVRSSPSTRFAAGRLSRLVRTVQLSDTGIVPGSGVKTRAPRSTGRRSAFRWCPSACPRSRTAARSPMRSRSSSTAHSEALSTTCPSRSSSPRATSTARSRIPPGSSATRSTCPPAYFCRGDRPVSQLTYRRARAA